MWRVLSKALVAAGVSLIGAGCQGEPAPQGYHYELVNNGKRTEQVMVPDPDPGQATKPLKVMVRTASEVPGPGDYYIYVTEGKHTSRVLVHDEEVKGGPQGLRMEVSPDQVCPHCRQAFVNVGKTVERRFYCDPAVHVPPAPSRAGPKEQ